MVGTGKIVHIFENSDIRLGLISQANPFVDFEVTGPKVGDLYIGIINGPFADVQTYRLRII
jgi:hypothetical protein